MPHAHNGTIELAYETFGDPDDAPLLLISGTAVQMLIWPEEFCEVLVQRGLHVARFDNRDSGLSTHLHDAPTPGWLKVMLRPSAAPYHLSDMALDALAVMDTLNWRSAHIVGASLGGMIAQTIAIDHPDRVRTLTSIMSTPSSRIATRPTPAAILAMTRIAGQQISGPDEAARQAIAFKHAIGGRSYPIDEQLVADIARRSHRRSPHNESADARQRGRHRLRRPPEAARPPDRAYACHTRRTRSCHPAQRRHRHRRRGRWRQARHLRRHGPRPPPRPVARHHRRDRAARRPRTPARLPRAPARRHPQPR